MDLSLYCIKTGENWQQICATQIVNSQSNLFMLNVIIIIIFASLQLLITYLATKKKGFAFWFGVFALDFILIVVSVLIYNYLPQLMVNFGIIK